MFYRALIGLWISAGWVACTPLEAKTPSASSAGLGEVATEGFAWSNPHAVQANTKYYVDVWEVKTSQQGKRTTRLVKTYSFKYFADAASERDYWNAIPAWTSGGYRYYYMARIR